jgi:hypothetical protein
MRKGVIILYLLLGSVFAHPESPIFSSNDLNVTLKTVTENKKIHVYLTIRNKKNEACYIPFWYLNFYCEEDGEQTMKNDWLRIIDEKNKIVPYYGLISNPIKKWETSDCFFLAKEQEYIISLYDIQSNYLFPKTKRITMKYYGPLGESNVVKLKLK